MLEQPALAREAAAISRERAVGADDAMARDDDADGIAAIGAADGANGAGTAEARSERAIAQRRARRDGGEPGPDAPLKRRAGGAPGDRREARDIAVEIAAEAAHHVGGGGAGPRL